MRQFREKPDFHDHDTAKNPVVYPPQWLLDTPKKPTIPHIVGVVVIGLSSAYALFEAAWLLVKAFVEAVK